MLPKENRFSFKKGTPKRSFASPLFVLRYDTSPDSKLHCAVVVGKKVDKKAVIRNKVKRKLVSLTQAIVEAETPCSLVIFARKKVLEVTDEEIKQELEHALKQTKII